MLSGQRSGPSYLSERRSEEKELRREQILDAAEVYLSPHRYIRWR